MTTPQIHEEEVGIGATTHQGKAPLEEPFGKRPGVVDDLRLITLESGFQRLLERHGLRSDDVHEGTSLRAREDRFVDRSGVLFLAENEPTPGPSEGLVGRRRNHVCMLHRTGMEAARHQAGDVCHVDQEVRTHLAGDRPKSFEVDGPRIGARPGDDHVGASFQRLHAQGVIVDATIRLLDSVRVHPVQLAAEIHR